MPVLTTLTERARSARAVPLGVPSPCISVCSMDPVSGLCQGCLRTLEEIAGWSRMRDDDKRQVWTLIEQRASRSSA